MAVLNFPDTSGQPTDGSLTYTENNVTYSWNGTYWSANNAADLDNRYVNITGDTMTGDLVCDTTGALTVPVGTETQAPTTAAGQIRLNSETGYFEVGVTSSIKRKLAYVAPLPAALPDYTAVDGATLPASGQFDNITIPAGVTVTVPVFCILTATGNVDIQGIINGNHLGNAGGPTQSASATSGSTSTSIVYGSGYGNLGGTYGFQGGQVGSGGQAGQALCNGGAAAGGSGGRSGATIAIVADGDITIGAAGMIQCQGNNAGFSAVSNGTLGYAAAGGGGGSGGCIFLQGTNVTNSGQLFAGGGDGTVTNFGAGSTNFTGAGGGGGGGGGYIVFNHTGSFSQGSVSVQGGTGKSGTGNSSGQFAVGGTGGGFAGIGGVGGNNASAGAGNGGAGQILENVPFQVL